MAIGLEVREAVAKGLEVRDVPTRALSASLSRLLAGGVARRASAAALSDAIEMCAVPMSWAQRGSQGSGEGDTLITHRVDLGSVCLSDPSISPTNPWIYLFAVIAVMENVHRNQLLACPHGHAYLARILPSWGLGIWAIFSLHHIKLLLVKQHIHPT